MRLRKSVLHEAEKEALAFCYTDHYNLKYQKYNFEI